MPTSALHQKLPGWRGANGCWLKHIDPLSSNIVEPRELGFASGHGCVDLGPIRFGEEMPGPLSDPIDVILLQDRAFGPERIDYDLWMTTLANPVRMLGSADPRGRVLSHAAVIRQIQKIEAVARADGVTSMRTRILTHIRPAEDLAIVASMRDMLSAKMVVLRTSSVTWTLGREEDIWKISQIFFDGRTYSTQEGLPTETQEGLFLEQPARPAEALAKSRI